MGRPLDWQGFLAAIRRVVPGLPALGPNFRLADPSLGRFQRAGLRKAVQVLGRDAPDDLVQTIETLDEAYEWYLTRLDGSASSSESRLAPSRDALTANGVRLRPLTPEDWQGLYYAALDPASSFRWRWRGSTPSFQHFMTNAYEGVLAQFAVADLMSEQCHGLVAAYNANIDSGYVYFAFQRSHGNGKSTGQMMSGSFLFFEYIFRTWPFRKIYFEMPEYNYKFFLSSLGELLVLEGTLREYFFRNGQYLDMYVVSLSRESWRVVADAYWSILIPDQEHELGVNEEDG